MVIDQVTNVPSPTILITALFGEYDNLRRVPTKRCYFDNAVCVTDRQLHTNWNLITESNQLHPRLAAKRAKCTPWHYVDAGVTIWLDASASIINGNHLKSYCLDLLATNDIVVWKHWSDRKDIMEEAMFCKDWPKYQDQPLIEQVEHYRARGLPYPSGLWECGLVAMRHTPKMKEFGEDWLYHNQMWSLQDQLSFPYLAWKHDLKIGAPKTRLEVDFIAYHKHNRSSYEDE